MSSLQTSRIPHIAWFLLAKRAGVPRRAVSQHLRPSEARPVVPVEYSRSLVVREPYYHRYASTRQRLQPGARLPRQPIPAAAARRPAPRQDVLHTQPDGASSRRPARSFKGYFWAVSLFGFVLSSYLAYLYQSYKQAVKESTALDLPQNADVSSRWLDLSRNFDDEVDLSEKLMRLGSKRRKLCKEAYGNVLEVSAGTGRNMEYYNLDSIHTPREKRIKGLVFNDLSEIMVYQAEKKFDKLQEEKEAISKFRGPVKFVVGDASDRLVISRPAGGFDTIIQTMGICSMANPVGFLKRLGELCRQPGESSLSENAKSAVENNKRSDYCSSEEVNETASRADGDKGGRILLLEHGRSHHGFINRFLDNNAKLHAHRYGCWNNKHIEQVVQDSGLEIESSSRYHFGTTYEYVLRPKKREEKDAK